MIMNQISCLFGLQNKSKDNLVLTSELRFHGWSLQVPRFLGQVKRVRATPAQTEGQTRRATGSHLKSQNVTPKRVGSHCTERADSTECHWTAGFQKWQQTHWMDVMQHRDVRFSGCSRCPQKFFSLPRKIFNRLDWTEKENAKSKCERTGGKAGRASGQYKLCTVHCTIFLHSQSSCRCAFVRCCTHKKQHADKERKLNKEKNEKKWIALCGYVQVFPSLYDIECEDWKNTALRKQRFADITKQLNKEFNTEHTGRSTCIFFLSTNIQHLPPLQVWVHKIWMCSGVLLLCLYSDWHWDEVGKHPASMSMMWTPAERRIEERWSG